MNGERKSCTERILSAIEYGKLSNEETERRLCELVETEVNKTDAEADMELIKACQSLMWQLQTHGEVPYESHCNQNWARITKRLNREERAARTAKSVGRMLAVAAAVVFVVLGLRGDLKWNWLEHQDTPDQQQHIVTANEVGIELVQKAMAEYADIGQIRVTTTQEFAEYISFVPMPQIIEEIWEFSFADITTNPIYMCIDAQYVNAVNQSTVTYSTVLYSAIEDAYSSFVQSSTGTTMLVDGHKVYVTTNMHRQMLCWSEGLVLIRVSGELQEQEGLSIVHSLLREWYCQ